MKHNVEFRDLTPSPRLQSLIESAIARLVKHVPAFDGDPEFLRLTVQANGARTLYHVSLVCSGLPIRKTLAAKVERHDVEDTVREAFAEIHRQLEKHKELLSGSHMYKRPARRATVRRARVGEVAPRGQGRGA